MTKSGESGEKLEKVAKSWKKWRKVRISGKAGEKWQKLEKVGILFLQNGRRRPFWMTKNHFRLHFSPFQINTQLFFFDFFFQNGRRPPFWKSFWAILDDRKSLSIPFLAISDQYATIIFFEFFFKMAASGHFGSPICAKNNRVLPLCVINGYAKYEVDR